MDVRATVTVSKIADFRSFVRREISAVRDFENELWLEQQPGEPELPDEVAAWLATSVPPMHAAKVWAARGPDGVLVGLARLLLPEADNRHTADVQLRVRPGWRRQGVGTELFTRVVAAAEADNRELLLFLTFGQVPSGEVCLAQLGAAPALVQRTSDLDLIALDVTVIDEWMAAADGLASKYELWFVEGPYPAAVFPDIAAVETAMNGMPRDELEIEDTAWTTERVAQREAELADNPGVRWSLMARERDSLRPVGLTRVYFYATWPGHVDQGDTGVLPAHRGQGIGRWLKAAMIQRILRDRPDSRRIRTNNAFSNEPMLAINNALGFVPSQVSTRWQVAAAAARAALAACRSSTTTSSG